MHKQRSLSCEDLLSAYAHLRGARWCGLSQSGRFSNNTAQQMLSIDSIYSSLATPIKNKWWELCNDKKGFQSMAELI